MRKRLVVANWKMNLTLAEAERLVEQLEPTLSASARVEIVLCPSLMGLEPLKRQLKPMKFEVGAQNVHYLDHGAYTGEVSAAQVRGLAKYVIVGHSERRMHFGETNDVIARKAAAVVRNQMTPIICVGENLFERQDDETKRIIHDQLAAGLIMLTGREVASVVVAYEPVWAIGTGEIAKPEQVKDAITAIRKTVTELYGEVVSAAVRVIYGGSVVPEFAKEYLKIKTLDGFLVGGASLNSYEFSSIVKSAQGSDRIPQKNQTVAKRSK